MKCFVFQYEVLCISMAPNHYIVLSLYEGVTLPIVLYYICWRRETMRTHGRLHHLVMMTCKRRNKDGTISNNSTWNWVFHISPPIFISYIFEWDHLIQYLSCLLRAFNRVFAFYVYGVIVQIHIFLFVF